MLAFTSKTQRIFDAIKFREARNILATTEGGGDYFMNMTFVTLSEARAVNTQLVTLSFYKQ